MEKQESIIPVTLSTLPPFELYLSHLKEIWKTRHLTNFGPLANKFEKLICEFIGNPQCLYVTNGTIALQLAIKALNLSGEVITTPFSFVATSASIFWEGCQPRLVDIDPQTLNIDPNKIESAITPSTTGILVTHVYGNPCDIDALERICHKHGLKLIFDAAHCFGIQFRNKPLLNYGDISTCSLHATKVFHSVEGGLISFQDPEIGSRLDYMRNFGFNGPEDFQGFGINAKVSELHAAMGLALWPTLKDAIDRRLKIHAIYDQAFDTISKIRRQHWAQNATRNGAYYPIILASEEVLLKVQEALRKKNVYPRRYFYPSLSRLEYVKYEDVSISDDISRRVLCLPIYPDLKPDVARQIAEFVIHLVQEYS